MKNYDLNMQEKLETVIRLKMDSPGIARSTEIWAICHDLAEAQYPPALTFFIEGLNDLAWELEAKVLANDWVPL